MRKATAAAVLLLLSTTLGAQTGQLVAANIAAMLRPGGFLLSNDRIFELPGGPVVSAGRTAAAYMNVPGSGPRGDRIYWHQARTPPPLPWSSSALA